MRTILWLLVVLHVCGVASYASAFDTRELLGTILNGLLSELERKQRDRAAAELQNEIQPYITGCDAGEVQACDRLLQYPLPKKFRRIVLVARERAVAFTAFRKHWNECRDDDDLAACNAALQYQWINRKGRKQIRSWRDAIRKRREHELRRQRLARMQARQEALKKMSISTHPSPVFIGNSVRVVWEARDRAARSCKMTSPELNFSRQRNDGSHSVLRVTKKLTFKFKCFVGHQNSALREITIDPVIPTTLSERMQSVFASFDISKSVSQRSLWILSILLLSSLAVIFWRLFSDAEEVKKTQPKFSESSPEKVEESSLKRFDSAPGPTSAHMDLAVSHNLRAEPSLEDRKEKMGLSDIEKAEIIERQKLMDSMQGKSTAVALILSFLIPGLGDFYCGSWVKGLVILSLYVLSVFLIFAAGIGVILMFIVWVVGLISAALSASKSSKRSIRRAEKSLGSN